MRVGIRAQKEKSGVTKAVGYLSYPGLSEKEIFKGGGGLIPCLWDCFASSCVIQLAISLFKTDVH